jgi:hypothetical protein
MFLPLNQAESALQICVKMKEYKLLPESTRFMVIVEWLVKHGLRDVLIIH